ncbi:prepilin-type N-terminal cleavage/methylation domain-containing protein [Hippea maritima]|uniref:Uncharacterized protein n=1 Tax=Hippea maritima (strain ATCC 700847 / DSM 10411 / MH2) TaxID=760142 RepID=F2LWI7_HIPMA|nr:prepilin-type N-terminal cleavage/methylation domain-containing protein [Hippea maritima]AEA34096.1 hypothetical protein Hipma_1130 [Hippea maritima DSM 10411]
MRKEGFTLIELIIVIVILGILAAVAVPKFAGLTKEAKISAVKGFAGSVRAAMNIVHGKWLVQDNSSIDNVTLEDGTTVYVCLGGSSDGHNCASGVIKGYPAPDTDGIGAAVDYDNDTFEAVKNDNGTNNTITFYYKGYSSATNKNCYVRYDYSTSGEGPKITVETDDCE